MIRAATNDYFHQKSKNKNPSFPEESLNCQQKKKKKKNNRWERGIIFREKLRLKLKNKTWISSEI